MLNLSLPETAMADCMQRVRNVTLARAEDTEEEAARALVDLLQTQQHEIVELIDAGEGITEEDRPLLLTSIGMTQTEFDLLAEFLRVYDQARSHFIFEICDPSVKRFLNANRIRFEEEENARMPWAEYKVTLLDRMQNSSTIDGLLSYVIKPRENNCPIGLWVSKRLVERRLLNDDGIDMSEETCFELILAFITNEEKQTLQIPARDRRAEIGGAYGMQQLQQALTRFDPSTFKLFRQTNCRDPVALRVIEIDRLFSAEKKKPSSTSAGPKKEAHVAVKPPAKAAALPTKNGAPDATVYDAFLPGSLRRRVWDAIIAAKCPRCSGDHLRVACTKPRQAWEDDFEKDDFFTKTFVKSKKPDQRKKQARVQISATANRLAPSILWVTCPSGWCLVDTCSDISLARRDALSNLSSCRETVEHLGGETMFEQSGVFSLDGPDSGPFSVTLSGVFAVEPDHLPEGFVALLRVSDLRGLSISLDFVMANPGCDWRSACIVTSLESVFRTLGLGRPPASPITEVLPARSPVSGHAPLFLQRVKNSSRIFAMVYVSTAPLPPEESG